MEWNGLRYFSVFFHPSSSRFYHRTTNSDGVEWIIGVRFFVGKSRLKLRQSQTIFETGHEKNSFLHMRKKRRRSASG